MTRRKGLAGGRSGADGAASCGCSLPSLTRTESSTESHQEALGTPQRGWAWQIPTLQGHRLECGSECVSPVLLCTMNKKAGL